MVNLPMPPSIDSTDLECVMLDVQNISLDRFYAAGKISRDDLFYGDIPQLQYTQGAVCEREAHVTLLFGIHPSEVYVDDVMAVLDGWTPDDVLIKDVGFFPSSIEGQDYNVIVLNVVPTPNLLEARRRLEQLVYTDRFPEFKPHVTIAYIKGEADKDAWISALQGYFSNRVLVPTGLNLGLDDE